jgi:hypothetical protein
VDPLHGVQAYNQRQRQVLGRNIVTGRGLNLHERLRRAVANATGMEVVYDVHWGLPGVQITFSHRIMEFEVFQAHIDGSWAPIKENFTDCVPGHRLSVTLTLQSPSSGAGLDLWSFDRSKPECTDDTLRQASAQIQAWERSDGEHGKLKSLLPKPLRFQQMPTLLKLLLQVLQNGLRSTAR